MTQQPDILTLDRDIAPGEHFAHVGPVILNGNIGAQAVVVIKNGGLHVKGTVADNAMVGVEGQENQNITVISGNGNTIMSVSGGGSVTINGIKITGGQASGPAGLQIDGQIGNCVSLKTKKCSVTL